MLTLRDHSRYAYFRNRATKLVPPNYSGAQANRNFWRWWTLTFCRMAVTLKADMPRHAMIAPCRNKDWRKSAAKPHPVKAARKCVRHQRSAFGCLLAS